MKFYFLENALKFITESYLSKANVNEETYQNYVRIFSK